MSLSAVKPHFVGILESLDYNEWPDAFNFENIPQAILDKAFHVQINDINGSNANQSHHTFVIPITLRVFVRGFRDTDSTRDDALLQADAILAEILKPSNRLTITIKDIIPNVISINPVADSNDNDMVLEMSFNTIIMCVFNN